MHRIIAIVTFLIASGAVLAQDPPAAPGAQAPHIACDGNDLLLTWLEPAPVAATDEANADDAAQQGERPRRRRGPRTYRMQFARFAGDAWSDPVTIVERDDLFVNWADVPSVVRGGNGALYAHWLQKSGAGTYAYDVMLAKSDDGGATWAQLGKAHDDHTQTEHGFVSFVPIAANDDEARGAMAKRGGVHAFWLDGREMSGGHDDGDGHGGGGNMTLRTAVVGETPGEAHVLDARVCECCPTSAAMTANGPIIAYRDRGPDERRDISVVRWLGAGWSVPHDVSPDNWILPGCPVNGPAIDARGNDVVVAWFTGVGISGAVLAAWSHDGGATFDEPVMIDDSFPIGRTDVRLLKDGTAVVTWLDVDNAGGAIKAQRIAPDGTTGPITRLAESAVSRTAGFPVIELLDDKRMMLVWTEEDQRTRLRAEVIAVPEIE